MDTVSPASSTFFDRRSLLSYQGGKYLLAANGPVIEAYDIAEYDKQKSGKSAERENTPPWLKLTVASTDVVIDKLLVLGKRDDIVAIGAEVLEDSVCVRATLVPKEIILTGGFIGSPMLTILAQFEKEEAALAHTYLCETVTGRDTFLLVTARAVRVYQVDERGDFSFERSIRISEEFELHRPLCVAPSLQFEFFAHTTKKEVVLVQLRGEQWYLGRIDGTNHSPAASFIPNQQRAIVTEPFQLSLVSTSKGRKKELLRIVDIKIVDFSIPLLIKANAAVDCAEIFLACAQGCYVYTVRGERLKEAGLKKSYIVIKKDHPPGPFLPTYCPLTKDRQIGHIVGTSSDLLAITTTRTKKGEYNLYLSYQHGDLLSFNANRILRTTKRAPPNELPRYFDGSLSLRSHNQDVKHHLYSKLHLLSTGTGSTTYPGILFSARGSVLDIHNLLSNGLILSNNTMSEDIYANQGEITCADFRQVGDMYQIVMGTTESPLVWQFIQQKVVAYKLKTGSSDRVQGGTALSDFEGTICAARFVPSSEVHALIIEMTPKQIPRLQLLKNIHATGTDILDEFALNRNTQWLQHNLLIFGDRMETVDVWVVHDKFAAIHKLHDCKLQKAIVYSFDDDWKGKVQATATSSCRIALRRFDIVAVAKEHGCLGILMTRHKPSDSADSIYFAEWPANEDEEETAGIHMEIIQSERASKKIRHIRIRLFLLTKRGSITIHEGTLISDRDELSIENVHRLGTVDTCVTRPDHFVVTNYPNQPKYAVVTGEQGTQVVRICNKKLRPVIERISSESVESE